jgi:hypothetical protein
MADDKNAIAASTAATKDQTQRDIADQKDATARDIAEFTNDVDGCRNVMDIRFKH